MPRNGRRPLAKVDVEVALLPLLPFSAAKQLQRAAPHCAVPSRNGARPPQRALFGRPSNPGGVTNRKPSRNRGFSRFWGLGVGVVVSGALHQICTKPPRLLGLFGQARTQPVREGAPNEVVVVAAGLHRPLCERPLRPRSERSSTLRRRVSPALRRRMDRGQRLAAGRVPTANGRAHRFEGQRLLRSPLISTIRRSMTLRALMARVGSSRTLKPSSAGDHSRDLPARSWSRSRSQARCQGFASPSALSLFRLARLRSSSSQSAQS
jgi:hypothetical protein